MSTVFEVQRYDHTWHGWRPVVRAFNDDDPARYDTESEAKAVMESLVQRGGKRHHLRIVPVDTPDPGV